MSPFPAATAALLAPLVLWRLYMRMRRVIGRQESKLWRHWCAAVFMPLLLAALGWLALPYDAALGGWAAGTIAGVLLGLWGLRLARFETSPEGWFYTPNMHIGIALSALLIARIAYRAVVLYEAGGLPGGAHAMSGAPPHVAIIHLIVTNPITLGIISLRLGYAAAFGMGLVRWRLAQRQAKEQAAATPPPA
jgi:hypothetical protein